MSPCGTLQFLSRILSIPFFLIFLIPYNSLAQDKVKNVVIFFSHGPNLPAFEKVLAGLNTTLGGSTLGHVNIITEYLDIGRSINDDHYPKFIIDIYNKKVKEFNIDLLITVGPGVNDAPDTLSLPEIA